MAEIRESTVFIVDDDDAVRDSLIWLLESVGLQATPFARARDFLDGYRPDQPGCLLLDVRMPEMGGLQLQQELGERGIQLPVLVITGHGDVPMAVAAMKQGAMDFIEKPWNEQHLLDCVQNALALDRENRRQDARREDMRRRYRSLTPREREVMERVAQGLSNKAIAEALSVSRKTVEVHRAKVMDKMGAASLSDLIQMAMGLKILQEYAAAGEADA